MGVDPTIVVAVIGAVAAIITTYLQFRQRRRVEEVHEQVKNTHTTNLREDIDEGFSHLRREIAGLRRDLRAERQARIKLQEQVDAELLRRRGNRVRQ